MACSFCRHCREASSSAGIALRVCRAHFVTGGGVEGRVRTSEPTPAPEGWPNTVLLRYAGLRNGGGARNRRKKSLASRGGSKPKGWTLRADLPLGVLAEIAQGSSKTRVICGGLGATTRQNRHLSGVNVIVGFPLVGLGRKFPGSHFESDCQVLPWSYSLSVRETTRLQADFNPTGLSYARASSSGHGNSAEGRTRSPDGMSRSRPVWSIYTAITPARGSASCKLCCAQNSHRQLRILSSGLTSFLWMNWPTSLEC